MSEYRPGEVAGRLGIAAPTLRRWSVQFADLLSPGASAAIAQHGGALERRYTADDIALLQRVSALLARGLTYDQARRALVEVEPPAAPLAPLAAPDGARALVELASAQREAIAAQRETIAMLRSEVERLRVEGEHTRARYLGIIRKLVEQLRGR